jgi:hypothetical protein
VACTRQGIFRSLKRRGLLKAGYFEKSVGRKRAHISKTQILKKVLGANAPIFQKHKFRHPKKGDFLHNAGKAVGRKRAT